MTYATKGKRPSEPLCLETARREAWAPLAGHRGAMHAAVAECFRECLRSRALGLTAVDDVHSMARSGSVAPFDSFLARLMLVGQEGGDGVSAGVRAIGKSRLLSPLAKEAKRTTERRVATKGGTLC